MSRPLLRRPAWVGCPPPLTPAWKTKSNDRDSTHTEIEGKCGDATAELRRRTHGHTRLSPKPPGGEQALAWLESPEGGRLLEVLSSQGPSLEHWHTRSPQHSTDARRPSPQRCNTTRRGRTHWWVEHICGGLTPAQGAATSPTTEASSSQHACVVAEPIKRVRPASVAGTDPPCRSGPNGVQECDRQIRLGALCLRGQTSLRKGESASPHLLV